MRRLSCIRKSQIRNHSITHSMKATAHYNRLLSTVSNNIAILYEGNKVLGICRESHGMWERR